MNGCIQTIKDIGSTTYIDVCADRILRTVPWGAMDWLTMTLITGCAIGITAMFGVMIYMATDVWRHDLHGD